MGRRLICNCGHPKDDHAEMYATWGVKRTLACCDCECEAFNTLGVSCAT